jgi:hypothetical protein
LKFFISHTIIALEIHLKYIINLKIRPSPLTQLGTSIKPFHSVVYFEDERVENNHR